MGTIQIMTKYKCCSDDLEIDEDDNEKNILIDQQHPTIKDSEDKIVTLLDSFNTTIPCSFPN